VDELRKEVAERKEERELLASKSAETLWLADIETFVGVYEVFLAKKAAIYAEAQKVKVVGGSKKKAAVAKKK
jgi:hypothetical protein